MKKREERNVKRKTKSLIIILILASFLLFLGINLYNSVVFKNLERINIFIYQKEPFFLSISNKGDQNYELFFYPDLKLNVPGGFSYYRVGALNKLVSLEKKPALFQKVISSSTQSFLNFYFYPKKTEIFFGKDIKPQTINFSLKNILFGKSNANLFDRLYIAYKLIAINKNEIVRLNTFEKVNNNKDVVFDSTRFAETYNGIFFQSTYRTERKTVQILYTNDYSSAIVISQILESNGIRVVDISKTTMPYKKCTIIENQDKKSQTAESLESFYNCQHVVSDTKTSDIIMYLGAIESSWSTN